METPQCRRKSPAIPSLPANRERIARELSLRWELEAPEPDAETNLFNQTLRGSDLALQDSLGLAQIDLIQEGEENSSGMEYLTEKLKHIIIPRLSFEDTTLEEAIDFLRLRSTELDATELDPSKRGINFVIRKNSEAMQNLKIRELRLQNVPLGVALKYICEQTKLRFKMDDFAVTLVPLTETGDDIFTRSYQVPPGFVGLISGVTDPFAQSNRKTMKEVLMANGILFGEGSSATLSANGTLLITNTPTELDKVSQLVQAIVEAKKDESGHLASVLPEPTADPFASSGSYQETWAALISTPTFPERTRLYREANYYRNTRPTDETLIPLNRFWQDLAAWDGKGPFLSPHFQCLPHLRRRRPDVPCTARPPLQGGAARSRRGRH
jgi:hypothetical protein